MEVDMISSTGEHDQMDLITSMMMQMDHHQKLHDDDHHHHQFLEPLQTNPSLQELQFTTPSPPPLIFTNPSTPPSTLINPPSTLSFLTSNPNLAHPSKFRPYPGPISSSVEKRSSMAAMREMIFRIAAMQPIHIDPESIKPPKRRNVKISKDPQSVAARHRRERISERIRILQRLVPGGTKMDTASMLDEAIHYVKFLKKQVQSLEQAGANRPLAGLGFGTASAAAMGSVGYSPLVRSSCQSGANQMVGHLQMLR